MKNLASEISESTIGFSAGILPFALARSKMPRSPVTSIPSSSALALPFFSSMSRRGISSSKANTIASDSPGSSSSSKLSTFSLFFTDLTLIISAWKILSTLYPKVSSADNSSATLSGIITFSKRAFKRWSLLTINKFPITEVSLTTIINLVCPKLLGHPLSLQRYNLLAPSALLEQLEKSYGAYSQKQQLCPKIISLAGTKRQLSPRSIPLLSIQRLVEFGQICSASSFLMFKV